MLHYRNSSEAFQDGIRKILASGERITVRGSEVCELRAHAICIARPLERLYVLPHRHNNVFATIAETLWVMAGRNDIEFLTPYLPRAKQFSDDGKTWRGGYGPRLRHWYGVDQFKSVAELLVKDPNSRRAVMTIFDPARDFEESKDIPCNNWLHFMIRDGHLHLHVNVRSNDAMWGFSGINTYEWSVLQQMMAFWTGTCVGEVVYFISSFHLYERHYKRAHDIAKDWSARTLYDYGFAAPIFRTPLEDIDKVLAQCFSIEEKLRYQEAGVEDLIREIEDDFLRDCMWMLSLYASHINGATIKEMVRQIQALPAGDFKIAAIEYFSRQIEVRNSLRVTQQEAEFFSRFWQRASTTETEAPRNIYGIESLLHMLSVLHREKTRIYKDSWKKRGEVLGVLANISRKYDRLEVIANDNIPSTSAESLYDTAADLAVYSAKYLTFLAEQEPDTFHEFIAKYPPNLSNEAYADNLHGFEAVSVIILRRYAQEGLKENQSLTEEKCWIGIHEAYQALEMILIGSEKLPNGIIKCELAADLCLWSLRFLLVHASKEPDEYRLFLSSIRSLQDKKQST